MVVVTIAPILLGSCPNIIAPLPSPLPSPLPTSPVPTTPLPTPLPTPVPTPSPTETNEWSIFLVFFLYKLDASSVNSVTRGHSRSRRCRRRPCYDHHPPPSPPTSSPSLRVTSTPSSGESRPSSPASNRAISISSRWSTQATGKELRPGCRVASWRRTRLTITTTLTSLYSLFKLSFPQALSRAEVSSRRSMRWQQTPRPSTTCRA